MTDGPDRTPSRRELDAIERVIEAFERSDWTEIDVRTGDLRVHLSSSGERPVDPEPTEPEREREQQPAAIASTDGSVQVPDGATLIVAPSPGIVWRSPEPGAPPFVEVGQPVDADTTLCIVEVMKLMSHLKAGVRGEVVAIYGRNGVAVAKDEPLFAIAVESPPS